MARPITQHPPSALSFPSATRPSALGFGFGSVAPAGRSPFGNVSDNNISSSPSFNPFSSSPSAQASQSSWQVKPARPRPVHPISYNTTRTLKRTRHSISPSPPDSPYSSSPPTGAKRTSGSGSRSKDLIGVQDLALVDHSRLRSIKKSKQVIIAKESEDLDLGLMLATLPSSTHLQILMSLIDKDPSIKSQIMAVTPLPDLAACNDELYRVMDRVSRQYGEPGLGRYALSWERAEGEIVTFSKMAVTYLSFFHSTHLGATTSLPTKHNLLHTITKYTSTLVRLLPPHVNQSVATSSLSQLVNDLVSRWTEWVASVSQDVNEKGEIYAHSMVVSWAQNLAELVDTSRLVPEQCPDPGPITALVATISTIRTAFINQVGWLAGPSSGLG